MSQDGFGGKLKEFFGIGPVESYEESYYGDGFREEVEPARESRVDRLGRESALDREPRVSPRDPEDRYSRRPRSYDDAAPVTSSRTAGVRSYDEPVGGTRSAARRPVATPEPQLVRFTLSTYTQGSDLVESLKDGDVTVFNLGGMEKGEATRVLDFAAGLARGADAELKKLNGVRNYVLIPEGVHLEQSQLDQMAEDL